MISPLTTPSVVTGELNFTFRTRGSPSGGQRAANKGELHVEHPNKANEAKIVITIIIGN